MRPAQQDISLVSNLEIKVNKITLQFTQAELVLVIKALEKQPYKIVAQFLVDLQKQINDFNTAAQAKPIDTLKAPE